MSAVANEIWDILRGLAKSQEEFKSGQLALQAAQKQTDRILKKLSVDVKEVNKSVGRLTNRLGEFVEEAVRPSAVRLFRKWGIDIHEVQQNVTAKRDGEALEIDLLVVCCGD